MTPARLPFDPLRRLVALMVAPSDNTEHRRNSFRSVASVLGVPDRKVNRWSRTGLTPDEADKLATHLGQHPSAIWPEWWGLTPSGADEPTPEPFDPVIPATHPEGVEPGVEADDQAPPPAPSVRCCSCSGCGPQDDRANGGCDPRCLVCSFGVCACVVALMGVGCDRVRSAS